MRVGVLGGGAQGCCCALALAARGVKVTLFDRNRRILSRAAVANEGKVHLGYMYANDPGLATARTMMTGALAFAPFFARYLGVAIDSFAISEPASYVVHRDSQRSVAEVLAYLDAVHDLIAAGSADRPGAYFGRDLAPPPRAWSNADREAAFDGAVALAAFETPEIATDPVALANLIAERVATDPNIDVLTEHDVLAVDDTDRPVVAVRTADGQSRHRFDHVVNALWDGRLAVDATLDLRPTRPWLHRLKYGVSFRLPAGASPPPSATFVSGPFGEVVSYGDGLTYLTWYPVCLRGLSPEVVPPDWPMWPGEPLRGELFRDTLAAMAEFVTSLRSLNTHELTDVNVRGGVIVAWGATDIYDPGSELHRRYEIGVTSHRRYHSVDPGKLTMAPYFADLCAERILTAGAA